MRPRPRVEIALQRLAALALLLLVALGAGCALGGAWTLSSGARAAGVGLAVACLVAAFLPAGLLRGVRLRSRRGLWFTLATLALLGVGLGQAPWGALPLAFLVWCGGLVLLTGALLAARTLPSPRPLLASAPPGGLLLLIVALELYGHHHAAGLGVWGEGLVVDAPFQLGPGGMLRPGLDLRIRSNDHAYLGARLRTDGRGFRGDDAPLEPGAPVVLSVGDSFTGGFELDQEAFLGARLERRLRPDGVRVLTALVNDPAHALYWLQEHGLALRPRCVLLGLCDNDPQQVEELWGPGRTFQLGPDGRVLADPSPPPGEDPWRDDPQLIYPRPATFDAAYLRAASRRGLADGLLARVGQLGLYRALAPPYRGMPSIMFSYLLERERADGHKRLLDGVANLGFYARRRPARVEAIEARLLDLLRALRATVERAGARLGLVLYPQKFSVHPEEWAAMCEYWGLDPADFDLDQPRERLVALCRAEGIACLDLGPPLRAAARARPGSLYFPRGDIHLHGDAYAVVAEAVEPWLREQLPELSAPSSGGPPPAPR